MPRLRYRLRYAAAMRALLPLRAAARTCCSCLRSRAINMLYDDTHSGLRMPYAIFCRAIYMSLNTPVRLHITHATPLRYAAAAFSC